MERSGSAATVGRAFAVSLALGGGLFAAACTFPAVIVLDTNVQDGSIATFDGSAQPGLDGASPGIDGSRSDARGDDVDDEDGGERADAAVGADTSTPGHEAGEPPPDAGTSPDSAQPPVDASPPQPDAAPPVDAGPPPMDSGPSPGDGGPAINCTCGALQMYPVNQTGCGLLATGVGLLACGGGFTGNPPCGTAGEFIDCVNDSVLGCTTGGRSSRIQQCR